MGKKEKNRRGEITTQQIVLLIILIVSFAVILFFLVQLNPGKTTDKEVCHNSVATRGSGVLPEESIPLNCKTDYICLTQDRSCENMVNPDIKNVKITDGVYDEVYETLAKEMADCWWTFGEGKLNYVGKELQSKRYCSICSQVGFDNSLGITPISQEGLYDYLAKTNMPDKEITYLDYLVGLKSSDDIQKKLKEGNKDALILGNSNYKDIDPGKQYYIITGISSKTGGWVGTAAVIGGVAGLVIAGPIGLVIGGGVGGVGGYFIGTTIEDAKYQYLTPSIIEASSEEFDKLQCASIKTLA